MKTYGYFFLFFLFAQAIYATDFYCDPINGNTNNDGSKANPWGSLESVFEKGIEFKAGDVIFLLSGNHGNVKVIGQNEKYITISGLTDQNPTINSIIFGTEESPASKWIFSNITFNGAFNSNTVFIHQNSSKIRLTENNFISNTKDDTAIDVKGTQCKIESNVISHYKNGIIVSGEKTQIRNNRINFFSHNAITILADSNLLEYNLIKESIATDAEVNSGIYFTEKETKGNIFRGNTIINFTKSNRAQIGVLNGIYGLKTIISESIFENNIVITNGKKGISLTGQLNNLKIVNNTVVNPYFGLNFTDKSETNAPLAIQIIGENDSSNLFIRNNLSNDVLFKNIKGIADYNLTLPVSVHDYDKCFNNWALFDFSLGPNSKALNSGTSDMAPNLDASQNKRSLGNFVNIGAFEYTKIDEANQVFEIPSEASDRQIHSKGKGDWDGQPQIRIGGVGENIDGAGVFPFKLPEIPGGKKILSANFKVYLSKVDNQPEGGIDLYALPPKSNFWVTEDLYYQGTFGQDVSARPIQNNFVDPNMYSGDIKTNNIGQKGLKDYLNTIFETETNSANYIFLRMNPNSKDVSDYNRWNFVSANGKKKENQPTLEITVGYPELNEGNISNIESIKNNIIIAPNSMHNGEFNVYFLGFKQGKTVQLKLLNFSGEQVFEQTINPSDLSDHVFRSENSKLPTGKYLLEYTTEGETKKQIFFVW
ncbi:right-handed parallel beta-helix repeat-containing protein [Winogradskyella sp. F6397]|uniref:Right-handed parallel beta-helix repeat-containing protein n=1 Tax=Winogradskyella marina TaxID=2785530 RepID=A0ABS0EFD2_9FLAO|nr:right-handed parallel beta-helix repeat-containing protein [Winogradskyella marina]MBF8149109.1 right-handed parallel beta-helix repeat-containing protein [Winogradskyella marina]